MKALNNKGISTLAIVLIVIIILLAGGVVWWGVNRNTNSNSNQNINNSVNGNANTNTTNQNTNVNISIDPVTGWNIYTNDKYDYRLKFPKEWQLVQINNDEETQSVIQGIQTAYIQNYSENLDVYHPQKGEINIDIHIYKISSLSLSGWFDEYLKVNRRDIYLDVTTEQTAIDGNDAIIEKITTGKTPKVPVDTEWLDGKITNYYIKHNQQVLELSAIVLSGDEDLLDTADQIVRSLTFLDSDTLETYQNNVYGYSVQYPKNWTVTSEGDVVNIDRTDTNQNVRISVKTKSENTPLLDYVLSQTSSANVVEGKYETPAEVTVNGIKGFRVLGEYVGTFVDTYIPLSNTSMIIIGGIYNSAQELETINQITDSLRLR